MSADPQGISSTTTPIAVTTPILATSATLPLTPIRSKVHHALSG